MAALKFDDLRFRAVEPKEVGFFRRHEPLVKNKFFVVDSTNQLDLPDVRKPSVNVKKIVNEEEVKMDLDMMGLEAVGEPLEISMINKSDLEQCIPSDVFAEIREIENEAAALPLHPISYEDARHYVHSMYDDGSLKMRFCKAVAATEWPGDVSAFFPCLTAKGSRIVGLVMKCVKKKKVEVGILQYFGKFDAGVRDYINFDFLSHLSDWRFCRISYHSVHNCLTTVHAVRSLPNWPRYELNGINVDADDFKEETLSEDSQKEFVAGAFIVDSEWSEEVTESRIIVDKDGDEFVNVSYFAGPGGLVESAVTVRPGWLDKRINGYERSIQIRFLLQLCNAYRTDICNWPSQNQQAELLRSFHEFVSALSHSGGAESSKYDFTETLWDYLCCCQSYESVKAIFDAVYNYFVDGTLTSKCVHIDNVSTVALILNSVNRATVYLPRLDQRTCLQLMIEIGVERVRRDLIHELSQKSFRQATYMDALNIQPRAEVEDRIIVVLRTHLVLQSINMISEFTTITEVEKQKLLNSLFDQYSKQQTLSSFDGEFVCKVKVCYINNYVLNINCLREWSATNHFSDSFGSHSVQTIHLTRFPEFEYLRRCTPSKLVPVKEHPAEQKFEQTDMFGCLMYSSANWNGEAND